MIGEISGAASKELAIEQVHIIYTIQYIVNLQVYRHVYKYFGERGGGGGGDWQLEGKLPPPPPTPPPLMVYIIVVASTPGLNPRLLSLVLANPSLLCLSS